MTMPGILPSVSAGVDVIPIAEEVLGQFIDAYANDADMVYEVKGARVLQDALHLLCASLTAASFTRGGVARYKDVHAVQFVDRLLAVDEPIPFQPRDSKR